jgi:GTPase SAR1 family protein
MLISGAAGSGKTSIIENICKFLQASVLAPTNAAVKRILDVIEDIEASTIHRTIYGAPDPLTGEWIKRSIEYGKTYIIDESSMIDRNVLKDIMDLSLRFNNKIIFIGDSYQLPPVNLDPKIFDWNKSNFEYNYLFDKKFKCHLSEVKRQQGEILEAANHVRVSKKPEILKFNNSFQVVDDFSEEITEDILNENDYILICFTNRNRIAYNRDIRKIRYEDVEEIIMPNEKVISVSNNSKINGEIFNISNPEIIEKWNNIKVNVGSKAYPKIKNYDVYYVVDKKTKENSILIPNLDYPSLYGMQLLEPLEADNRFFIKKGKKVSWNSSINIVTYGYAITAHKAQGQEFDKVYVDGDYLTEGDDNFRERWLYTAITRGKNDVRLLHSSYMKIIPC